jgi:hypothetical protein
LSRSSFSGSETEREPTSAVFSPAQDSPLSTEFRPQTPPRSNSRQAAATSNISPRQRLTSAPPSVLRGSIRSRRDSLEYGDRDAARSALDQHRPSSRNAVFGSPATRNRSYSLDRREGTLERQSPPLGRRPRQPLPAAFRQPTPSRDQEDVSPLNRTPIRTGTNILVQAYDEPGPSRGNHTSPIFRNRRETPSPIQRSETLNTSAPRPPPKSPRRSQTLTLREPLRGLRSDSHPIRTPPSEPRTAMQRFPLRSGTHETAGRSVVGESLKAAGIGRRRDDDVFNSGEGAPQRRTRLSGGLGVRPQLSNIGEAESDAEDKGRQPAPRASSRIGGHERAGSSPGPVTGKYTPHSVSRASPSMARFQEERLNRTAPPPLRSHSSFVTPDRRDRGDSVYTPPTPSQSRLSGRYSSTNLMGRLNAVTQSEHTKLMTDSLSMFESNLARLPTASNASLSAAAIPDLYRNAQLIVNTTSALNQLLREANSRALEEQIEAEIREQTGEEDISEIWRTVGSEYRESLRLSDDLVRTMTGFLLGMGRILREAVSSREPRHDDETRATSPNESTDRRSAESRRSLDMRLNDFSPRERERNREDSLRRLATTSITSISRAPSIHSSTQGSRASRERELEMEVHSPGPLAATPSPSPGFVTRRNFVPRTISRNAAVLNNHSEPRAVSQIERRANRRSLPLLSTPTPLPSLPSETLLARSNSAATGSRRDKRASLSTVRGAISSPTATTALTTSSSDSPEKAPFPLIRTNTGPTVTFSRSTESALSGLHLQREEDLERMRAISTSSAVDHERMAAVISPAPDSRRRIRDSYESMRDPEASTLQRSSTEPRRDGRRPVHEIFSR